MFLFLACRFLSTRLNYMRMAQCERGEYAFVRGCLGLLKYVDKREKDFIRGDYGVRHTAYQLLIRYYQLLIT